MKKIITILMITVLFAGCILTSYAAGDGSDMSIIYNKDISSTEQFLFNITRPEGDETTVYNTYIICGSTKEEGITIKLLKINDDGSYEPYANTDGESAWYIDSYGLFSKEVVLKEGANKIRVVAYKTVEGGNLELGRNLQINNFTVTLLNNSVREILTNGFSFVNIMQSFRTSQR